MMNLFPRMVGYAAASLALCAGLFSFAGMWFGEEESVRWLFRRLMFEQRRSEALTTRSETLRHSLESKERVIAEIMGRRLRLRQAIVQFQRITKELIEDLAHQDVDPNLIASYVPPSTDPETMGRQILTWVRVDVSRWPPDKTERLLRDLESEYRELFGWASLPDSATETALARRDASGNGEPHPRPR